MFPEQVCCVRMGVLMLSRRDVRGGSRYVIERLAVVARAKEQEKRCGKVGVGGITRNRTAPPD